jgi:hypothetical protein
MKLICFFIPRFRNTIKEAFVANVIWFMFQHRQLFTHHHEAKAIEVVATYKKNMGIVSNSSSSEGAH